MTATASSVSRSTSATRRVWKPAARGATRSVVGALIRFSLTCSNGSAQERQRRRAVQAVGPNRDTSSVSAAPHCGHATVCDGGVSVSGMGAPAAFGPIRSGGATPASASLRRPSSEIQSVDHGGLKVVRTSTASYPASCRAARRSSRIASSAGQPE